MQNYYGVFKDCAIYMFLKTIVKTIILIIMLLVVSAFRTGMLHAESLSGEEYRVKAGFIYNFAKFTSWPVSAFKDNRLNVVIVSKHPETKVFLALNEKPLKGKIVRILRYYLDVKNPFLDDDYTISEVDEKGSTHLITSENYQDIIKTCHIIYLATPNSKIIRSHLKWLSGFDILTIGESDAFLPSGGIINFFMEENRLRFMVNLDAVNKTHLFMSSQLLMSADIYRNP